MENKLIPQGTVQALCSSSATVFALGMAFIGYWGFASKEPWVSEDFIVVTPALFGFLMLAIVPFIVTKPKQSCLRNINIGRWLYILGVGCVIVAISIALILGVLSLQVNEGVQSTEATLPSVIQLELVNGQNDYHWWDVLGGIGSFLSGIVLVATAASLILLYKQTKANEKSAKSSAYEAISGFNNSINDFFINEPKWMNSIFEKFPADICDINNVDEVKRFFIASKWIDLFDLTLMLDDAIPDSGKRAWVEYIFDHVKASSYMQNVILNTRWYGPRLKRLAEVAKNNGNYKILISEWYQDREIP